MYSASLSQAFRALSLKYHPDVVGGAADAAAAHAKFVRLSVAYHTLIDPQRRARCVYHSRSIKQKRQPLAKGSEISLALVLPACVLLLVVMCALCPWPGTMHAGAPSATSSGTSPLLPDPAPAAARAAPWMRSSWRARRRTRQDSADPRFRAAAPPPCSAEQTTSPLLPSAL
jgi:hypothetical protein